MKSQRILLVDFGVPYAGAEVYLENLVQLLDGQVDFVVLCVNPELAASLRKLNVRVFSFVFALNWGKIVHMLIGIIMIFYLQMCRRINTVWIQGYTEVVLLPWARLLRCKTIATRHLTFDIEKQKWYKVWKRYAARFLYIHLIFFAQKVICVSDVVANDLLQVTALKNFIVIPNWVAYLPKLKNRQHPQKQSFRLLFVGRLERHKGVDLILNAMRQLKNNTISLTIVGDGKYRKELERQAKGLNVKFVGFQKNIFNYYRETDILINPSRGPEGLPLVSLEGMSYGLPCIFSDLAIHKEVTNNGEGAILFKCGEASDLCAKIQRLILSKNLLEKYGITGRNIIKNKYSADAARACYCKEIVV